MNLWYTLIDLFFFLSSDNELCLDTIDALIFVDTLCIATIGVISSIRCVHVSIVCGHYTYRIIATHVLISIRQIIFK